MINCIINDIDQEYFYIADLIKNIQYKFTFKIDGNFHIRILCKNDNEEYIFNQNIYSDKGIYKYILQSPIDGALYIKKSINRKNDWNKIYDISLFEVYK